MLRAAMGRMREWLLRRGAITRHYRPPDFPFLDPREPLFTVWTAERMRRDAHISFGLALRNGPLLMAEFDVKNARDERIKAFVLEEVQNIWNRAGTKILETKCFGYSAFEPLYVQGEDKLIHFHRLRPIHPVDVAPVTRANELVGFNLKGGMQGTGPTRVKRFDTASDTRRDTKLRRPKALWTRFADTFETYFGEPLLERSHGPWWERNMQGGAKQLRRLRMVKDAWIGDIIYYPQDGLVSLPSGDTIAAVDWARTLADNRHTGASLVFPSDTDSDGRRRWEYQPPSPTQGATEILEYDDRLGRLEFEGLQVPMELIQSLGSGSGFSGRSIPLISFLLILQSEGEDYLADIVDQILRPLVEINFGTDDDFDVELVSLLETVGQSLDGTLGGEGGEGSINPAVHNRAPRQSMDAESQPLGGLAQFSGDRNGRFRGYAGSELKEHIAHMLREPETDDAP